MQKKELRRKLIFSGPLVERLEFYYPVDLKRTMNTEKRKPSTPDLEKIASSVSRARSKLRRLVFTNFQVWQDKNGYIIPSKFLTLTFEENIQDLKSANYQLTKFIQKLNYTFKNSLSGSLQYVCVPEFQERGAIHYHLVLFNFPFVNLVFKRIRNLWKDRFVLKTINRNQDVSNVASYISKYITKQATDLRFWGQKRFFTSRGLKNPILLRDDIAIELACQVLEYFQKYKTIFFDVPVCGDVSYWLYYLNNYTIYSLPLLDPYVKEQIKIADTNKDL